MFEELLEVPPDAFDRVDAALACLEEHRVEANRAAYRLMRAATGVWEHRLGIAADTGGDGLIAAQSAVAEIAVALGIAQSSADTLVSVDQQLARLELTRDAFAAGDLDYATVRVIATVLADANAATVAAIEADVLAAAAHLSPQPLRSAIWRIWMRHDPDEAHTVRAAKHRSDRTAYTRRGTNGMTWLTACLTDLEGAEADQLISELAATVCAADPRPVKELRADALMALLHGESHLLCHCGREQCPKTQIQNLNRHGFSAAPV
ncbi:DUF222 domain-containing protein [Skermania sp. ID1734]|uniref:DUF222 domain-containing protein n=1 Tax=Skermania sp. ID1734 TaxID=2597516 RepID=UPI00117D075D|nr:DUF222 domain-containing protein [Skermania sp. ID1734]TSD98195.1 DUF222 domain-containing protein [Skermania sp. ID1734]